VLRQQDPPAWRRVGSCARAATARAAAEAVIGAGRGGGDGAQWCLHEVMRGAAKLVSHRCDESCQIIVTSSSSLGSAQFQSFCPCSK
jgi:hypothetical protein